MYITASTIYYYTKQQPPCVAAVYAGQVHGRGQSCHMTDD